MFSPIQLNKIVLSILKWNLPIKYSYITWKWAELWSKSERNKEHYDVKLTQDSIDLYLSEMENKSEILIIDFWPWIWETIIPILKDFKKRWIKIKYHCFDISKNIINILKDNIEKSWLELDFSYDIVDFEERDLSDMIFSIKDKNKWFSVLWLLLWNTVWNFTSSEKVLSNIMDWFSIDEKLVIWIERVQIENDRWIENTIKAYDTVISKKHDFATLDYFWVDINSWKFSTVFNRENSSIESFFTFEKDTLIKIWEKTAEIKSWEKIKLLHSRKINEENFSKMLIWLDFRICNLRTSKDNSYMQVLIENKKIF